MFLHKFVWFDKWVVTLNNLSHALFAITLTKFLKSELKTYKIKPQNGKEALRRLYSDQPESPIPHNNIRFI